mgnify:CR=1 FL=1
MFLEPVFASEVPRIWHEVKPLVDKALARADGEQLSEDVLQKLLNKEMILFAGIEANELASVCIAEILYYPRKKVLQVTIAATKSGRDFELWNETFEVVEDFGRAMGCTSVSAWVRKGFVKKLKWKHKYSVVTKDLLEE